MKLSEFIEKYGDCELTDELMEMLKPKGDCKLQIGEEYWMINGFGKVVDERWESWAYDYFALNKRNVYRTEEEAQFALDMYNLCKERSFKPDWDSMVQSKYYLILNNKDKEVNYNCRTWIDCCDPFYYPTAKAVNEVIDKYSFDELAKYYGRV